jgi:hypothetical protein
MAIDKLLPDLGAILRINSYISKQNLLNWFNENDIDYIGMTDMEMYIYYIKNANEE